MAVTLLIALVLPAMLVAVTITSMRLPVCLRLTIRYFLVAPLIVWQFFPFVLQLFHWYLYLIGVVPVQRPLVAISLFFPTRVLPLIFGLAVFLGSVQIGRASCRERV